MREMNLCYGCLVAFSSTVHDIDNGQDYTEDGMNGLPSRVSIADSFKSPEYRILIVSNKFQTGFDEPLLQTMYVDKRSRRAAMCPEFEPPEPRRHRQNRYAGTRLCE